MNIYEKLKELNKARAQLEAEVSNTGTADEWIDEAIKQGLVIEDRSKTVVYKKLESWGPQIQVYPHASVTVGSHTYDKLVGSAEYTAYNNKWEIKNFKKSC